MVKRYELSEAQWRRIEALLPGKPGDPGRTAEDNRLFVNGVLWVLRSGAHWHDLPERYGKWKSVHTRFARWAKSGVWERVFNVLTKDRKNEYLMLPQSDRTLLQQAQTLQALRNTLRPKSCPFPSFHPARMRHDLDALNVDSA